MGLGLIGAMAGLGEGIAKQADSFQKQNNALELEDTRNKYLTDRQAAYAKIQEDMQIGSETRQQDKVIADRLRISGIINGVKLPDGATEKERAIAVNQALEAAGEFGHGDTFYNRAKAIERNEVDKARSEAAAAREERIAKAQEASARAQAAAAGRAGQDQKWQQEDRALKEEQRNYVGWYGTAKSAGDEEGMKRYREMALLVGVDPEAITKNDPLSSQVAAAKATLADVDADPEEKRVARQVLTLSNQSYIDKHSKPSSEKPANKPTRAGSLGFDEMFPAKK